MSRLEQLETLVAVVESGSISAASVRLGVAKSGVSRRLAELERRLGVQLVRRTTRRLDLTDAGRTFYARSQRILEELDDAEQALVSGERALTGTLRVAAPLSFGIDHLSPAVSDFLYAHPGLTVELELDDSRIDLIERGCDVAIRIADLADSTLAARRLTPVRLMLAASPDYLARHGTPRHPDDLNDHACLRYANPGYSAWSWVGPDGARGSVAVSGPLSTNNGECLRDAAIAGHGITMEPNFIVHEAIRDGRLVRILSDYAWPEMHAWAVWPSTRLLARRVRAFVDFLAERFTDRPYFDEGI
jgi:DNA-binding transcriptional LysR family regulator